MIAIVNYGAGNITSVKRAIEHLGRECVVTADAAEIERAERVIIPGVGHFCATTRLAENGLTTAIEKQISAQKPVLGICLGMQWMFDRSEEAPGVRGLAAFTAACRALAPTVKSPHVGWDELEISLPTRLLAGLSSGAFVYFAHSYCAPLVDATVAVCDYGGKFSAAVERGTLFGVQFHPEKSGDSGLTILENFCRC